MRETLGFVGLGQMGLAMARRLLAQGFDVVGCDPAVAARDALVRAGGRTAATPRQVADTAEVVLACLPSAEASLMVACGAEGIAEGAAVRVYVECSTLGPEAMREIAARLQGRGMDVLDAPISGGPAGAEAGTLATVVAGPIAARERAAAAIAAYAATIVPAGDEAGLAQVFKLANQGLTFASFVLTAEAVTAGVKAGADPEALLAFLNAGTARNWSTSVKFPQSVLAGRFGPGSLHIVRKDLAMYVAMCRRGGIVPSMGAEAEAIAAHADHTLSPPVDLASIVRLYEAAAGIEVRSVNKESRE